jgi:hypothetical protein
MAEITLDKSYDNFCIIAAFLKERSCASYKIPSLRKNLKTIFVLVFEGSTFDLFMLS